MPKAYKFTYCFLPIFMTIFLISEGNICHLTLHGLSYIQLAHKHFQAKRNFYRLKSVHKFFKKRNTIS